MSTFGKTTAIYQRQWSDRKLLSIYLFISTLIYDCMWINMLFPINVWWVQIHKCICIRKSQKSKRCAWETKTAELQSWLYPKVRKIKCVVVEWYNISFCVRCELCWLSGLPTWTQECITDIKCSKTYCNQRGYLERPQFYESLKPGHAPSKHRHIRACGTFCSDDRALATVCN